MAALAERMRRPVHWRVPYDAARRRCLSTAAGSGPGEHPVIDLATVLNAASREPATGDSAPSGEHAATLAAMRAALTEHGYFYASGVAPVLPEALINSTYAFADRLHDLPLATKQLYARPEGSGETVNGIYSGADVGATEPAYEVGTLSLVRSWEYSRTRRPDGATDSSGFPQAETVGWGDHGDGTFLSMLDHLYAQQDALARALMLAFAEMFALPRRTFLQHFDGGDLGTIRLLRYPGPAPAGDGSAAPPSASAALDDKTLAGISAHTDFEAFTLMHQDAPGLQFLRPLPGGGAVASAPVAAHAAAQTSGREWVDAPVRKGEFVVIVGDMLERFTNGALSATPHRVLPTPWQRNSIVRFNAFHPGTVVAPLPQFVASGGGETHYTPVTMETHMATTLGNLEQGLGSWSEESQRSISAHRRYP